MHHFRLVPKKLPTTAPSSRSECHLTIFCIDQIVPGFVIYYLNILKFVHLKILWSQLKTLYRERQGRVHQGCVHQSHVPHGELKALLFFEV